MPNYYVLDVLDDGECWVSVAAPTPGRAAELALEQWEAEAADIDSVLVFKQADGREYGFETITRAMAVTKAVKR